MRNVFFAVIFSSSVVYGSVPEWYLNPPLNNNEQFYASGSGCTISVATNEALSQIASQINVSVSSSLSKNENQQTVDNHVSYSKDVRIQNSSIVGMIDFNNFTVLKSETSDEKTYLLLSVNKKIWLTENLDKFRALNSKIDALSNAMEDKPTSLQIRDDIEALALIKKAKYLIDIIATIDPSSIQRSAYWTKYSLYEQNIDEMLKNTVVIIDVKNSDLSIVGQALQDHFSDIKIVSSINPIEATRYVKIIITGDLKNQKQYGNFLITANVNFVTKDGEKVTSSTTKRIQQDGQTDYKTTREDLQKQIEKAIIEQGVFNFIGLK
jgi:LPP20 lipoprotein